MGSTSSEDIVHDAIRRQLRPGEIVLPNVRFSDPRNGDVEADLVILIPTLGAAVVEIKGGTVTFADGAWHTERGTFRRRIHPLEQARKAKHALRRYLDRQPEWGQGLLRTEWFVAMPHTDVTGDMGPEVRRDQILDRGDLVHAMDRIRTSLESPLSPEPRPEGDWAETALALLLRTSQAAPAPVVGSRFPSLRLAVAAVVSAAVAAFAWFEAGWRGAWIALAVVSSVTAIVWAARNRPATRRWRAATTGALVAAAGATIGIALTAALVPAPAATSDACSPDYEPCVPISSDVNCSAIRTQVRVIGNDPYDLDRDGDGYGCEMFSND